MTSLEGESGCRDLVTQGREGMPGGGQLGGVVLEEATDPLQLGSGGSGGGGQLRSAFLEVATDPSGGATAPDAGRQGRAGVGRPALGLECSGLLQSDGCCEQVTPGPQRISTQLGQRGGVAGHG